MVVQGEPMQSATPCGGEVLRGVTSGVSRETFLKHGFGGEVLHGVTSGVSRETSET